MMKKFDAIIIGSGQAGTPLAFRLASEGWKVAFIEKEKVGGTCLNTGCTPTKAYVASARRMWDASNGADLGVNIPGGVSVDLKKVKHRKDEIIKGSVDGITSGINSNDNIQFFPEKARFLSDKVVEVKGEEITADKIFINVGGSAFIPDGFQDVNYLTNKTILELEEVPEHLIVVGGSYIGLEFGQMFRRFGSKVTIVERGIGLITREDEDVSAAIEEFLKEEGVDIRLNSDCITGEAGQNGRIRVQMNCIGETRHIEGSHLLLATGRKPNTADLGLDNTSLKVDDAGNIVVDDKLQTNVDGVYALGDCNGKGAFTHTAYNDFEIVAANLLEGGDRKVSDRILIYGLFVDPPLGRVGLTKAQALEKGYEILEAYRPMSKVARAKEKGETRGFMRIIIDKNTEKILGASILGVGGDEVVGSIANLMYADAPYTVLRDSVQVHPTVSELLPTMLENPQLVD
ncbi:MAG: FAD-containing oxidoreductase [Saprospirales bacterium]|nr:MAG: FAD-containing oxidoreductase [Saprospirales bacterium]